MTMFRRQAPAASSSLLLLALSSPHGETGASAAAAAHDFASAGKQRRRASIDLGGRRGDVPADSDLGSRILSLSRPLRPSSAHDPDPDPRRRRRFLDEDFSFVSSYSVKFQGCHHISQWNGDADEGSEIRVQTKRLVRFRLCPTGSCGDGDAAGCNSKYGDYVVDMNDFVSAYLQHREDRKEYTCASYGYVCSDECEGSDGDNCYIACFASYGLSYCLEEGNNDQAFDPMDYAYCAAYDLGGNNGRRRRLDGGNDDEDVEYYVGPYCADQGGEIHLGLFTDDTCTTFSTDCSEECFYQTEGFELPYSDDSLVSPVCMPCAEPDENGQNQNDQADEGDVVELCESVYSTSGKCETKMEVEYPNEAACSYIEGIKILRSDGAVRTNETKRSRAAAICIGVFTTAAIVLAAYVYYLRTKLRRAKINLSSGGTSSAYA